MFDFLSGLISHEQQHTTVLTCPKCGGHIVIRSDKGYNEQYIACSKCKHRLTLDEYARQTQSYD